VAFSAFVPTYDSTIAVPRLTSSAGRRARSGARPPTRRGTRKGAAAPRSYKVQVLERAISLLEAFTPEHPERGVSELSREVSLNKATAHRILSVLEARGYVRQMPESGRYRLGAKLMELGSRAIAGIGLTDVSKPILHRLAAQTGETAHLMILDGVTGLYLEKVESLRGFRMPSQVGRRMHLHCTAVGKALLAYMPSQHVDEILADAGLPRMTTNTITSRAALKRELAQIRSLGYSVDREEAELGLRCVGAPVFDGSGSVIASLSIAGPAVRVTPQNELALAALVAGAAGQVSAELGYVPTRRLVAKASRNGQPPDRRAH
jgi:DNA-binding IclR family transcriptional regulator